MSFLAFAAVAGSTFNLICSGTITENSMFVTDKVEPYSVTYRVDLDTKQWCDGECKALHPIHEVQPAFLILEAPRDVDTPSRYEMFRSEISRETGKHTMLSTSGRGASILILKWQGQCDHAPFSEFPKPATKF
jgi:hypothetical protein